MKVRLSVLREYFSFLLVEGRVDDAREKFPDMEEDIFSEIVANQPSGSNNKYLMWSCTQVDKMMEDDPDPQAVQIVIQAVRLFDGSQQRLKQRDINQYKDVGEVENAVAELGKSKGEEKRQIKADSDTIYEDDNWLVVRPHTKDASCKYGTGTKWCIAAQRSQNYFASYSSSNNKFYFVINKKAATSTPESKYAIAYINSGSIQVYNASDKLVKLETVAKQVGDKWTQIWQKIQEHVKANPVTREVEESQKAAEEHVKNLLKGEKVSPEGLSKIAREGKLTTPVINALIKTFKDYTGPIDYRDPRQGIMSSLAGRAAEMPGDAATVLLNWILTDGKNDSYYYRYNIERILSGAKWGSDKFRELAQSKDEAVLANIFINPTAPQDLKDSIAAEVERFKEEEVRRKIYWEMIKSGNITLDQFKAAMRSDTREYGNIRTMILDHPSEAHLTPEMIRMIPIKSTRDFTQVLEMPGVPSDYAGEALSKLIQSGGFEKYDLYQILKTISLNTADIEKFWSEHKSPQVRTSLLQNPAIGAGNASKFARSKNSAFRFAVAHNTVTPPEDLIFLADDESVSTRQAVGANPKTPPETLTTLAKDEAITVRASVAGNAATPRNVLDVLRHDSDEFVRKAARKLLKTMATTETLVRLLTSMNGMRLLNEEMEDDATPDIMNPSWRDLPAGRDSIDPTEFIAVFLLQNNGSASREEINDAFQDWKGQAGHKDLWKKPWNPEKILRGISSQGRGWFWSPPGINKGALFRLTPAGASAAMEVLEKFKRYGTQPTNTVTSATAKQGKTYYLPADQKEAVDITGYEGGDISVMEVEGDSQGKPVKHDGKLVKLTGSQSRRMRRRGWRAIKVFKVEMPNGEVKYVESFPKVTIPRGAAVKFIKTFRGLASTSYYQPSESNRAVVKWNDRAVVVPFPLWAEEQGTMPTSKEKNVPPPVKKSAPAAPREPGAGRPIGPKVSYKIYGRKAGKSAHTRLKGQAYGAPTDTQFTPGEQATLQSTDDGKLKVKKMQGDHEQTWDPVEG